MNLVRGSKSKWLPCLCSPVTGSPPTRALNIEWETNLDSSSLQILTRLPIMEGSAKRLVVSVSRESAEVNFLPIMPRIILANVDLPFWPSPTRKNEAHALIEGRRR